MWLASNLGANKTNYFKESCTLETQTCKTEWGSIPIVKETILKRCQFKHMTTEYKSIGLAFILPSVSVIQNKILGTFQNALFMT